MIVWKKFHFDAAHHLPYYLGLCHNPHGHRWFLDVGVTGEVQSGSGMIIDFSELKEIINNILEKFDHHDLNDVIPNPTAEHIIEYLIPLIQKGLCYSTIKLVALRLYETPDSCIEWNLLYKIL
jgi:6-pyruvoyltetrahydropterin/6-carboxytetrahydropterin synthase